MIDSGRLTCTSDNIVYPASCVACGLQGVGSTINFKTRVANYKSQIKRIYVIREPVVLSNTS